MDLEALQTFYKSTSKVPGWLSFHDAGVIEIILSNQSEQKASGNLLEIGVYAGKSAIHIGSRVRPGEEFHVCDIFNESTDSKNTQEILRSYENLNRLTFEVNCIEFLGKLPVIHQCLSLELPRLLDKNDFRFIHIDGSHLYEHVANDLNFAISAINPQIGVIAVDDFRAQHTVGVALAVWQTVLEGNLIPLVMTPAKIYLGRPEINFDVKEIKDSLNSLGIQSIFEDILGNRVIRTLNLEDLNLYATAGGLTRLIPPILADSIKKSYLWKKFRRR
jgi:hypothetical protein